VRAALLDVAAHLPEGRLSNAMLAEEYPDWSVEKIGGKTGIESRRVVAAEHFTSDLAIAAAEKVLARAGSAPADVDYIVLVTHSPDYMMPATACLVQDALGIPTSAGALDVSLGCSGYVYALGLARGLIETGQSRRLLLITADTFSRMAAGSDRSTRTLFGDAATASIVVPVEDGEPGGRLGTVVYGTDGAGVEDLRIDGGAMRAAWSGEGAPVCPTMFMDGPAVFNFTLQVVPPHLKAVCDRAGIALDDVDCWVFHQANRFMLEHLRRRLKIPEERFVIAMSETGNTVSSTIPIAMEQALADGRIGPGKKVALVGFGVGFSWGTILLDYPGA